MPTLRNVNPLGDVEVPHLGVVLKTGEEFEVGDEIAGHAPIGEPGDKGYKPGEGLLAQVGNYELVTAKKKG